MTTPPTLGTVVVNHRRHDLLAGCLGSLRASSRPPDRIVVVDNESEAGPLAAAIEAAPGVVAIANADNRGYAAACNQGWRAAGTDVVLFLNADVTVDAGCLEGCLGALLASPDVGIVTARLRRPDGSLDRACHRGIPTPAAALWYRLGLARLRPRSRRFARYTLAWLDPRTEHDIEACSGAFLMVRRSALERLGGWDEGYRFYAEDLDLCVRAGGAGLRVRYVPSVGAVHVKGASSSLHRPDAELDARQLETKRWVRREIVRSHRRFYEQHLEAGTPRAARPLLGLLFTLQELRVAIAERRR